MCNRRTESRGGDVRKVLDVIPEADTAVHEVMASLVALEVLILERVWKEFPHKPHVGSTQDAELPMGTA